MDTFHFLLILPSPGCGWGQEDEKLPAALALRLRGPTLEEALSSRVGSTRRKSHFLFSVTQDEVPRGMWEVPSLLMPQPRFLNHPSNCIQGESMEGSRKGFLNLENLSWAQHGHRVAAKSGNLGPRDRCPPLWLQAFDFTHKALRTVQNHEEKRKSSLGSRFSVALCSGGA